MKNKPIGICHICGQTKELTAEHLPPRSAGNSKTVKFHTMDSVLHEDHLSGKKPLSYFNHKISQGGFHLPTICQECNNNTGSFYAPAYSEFAKSIMRNLYKNDISAMLNHTLSFKCQFKPLNVYKQILAMFCSILAPETVSLYKFGEFILDKTANSLNVKNFKLHMVLVPNEVFKIIPAYGIYHTSTGQCIMLSEFIAPPFGFVLNLTPDLVSVGLPDLSVFSDFAYDEISLIGFENIPFLRPLQSFMMFEGIPQDKIILW